jgi:hypothetical protein
VIASTQIKDFLGITSMRCRRCSNPRLLCRVFDRCLESPGPRVPGSIVALIGGTLAVVSCGSAAGPIGSCGSSPLC